MSKLPAFQFYPGDWMKDPLLSICSLSAQGLLMRLLCLCHESAMRGAMVLPSGNPISNEQLHRASSCGVTFEVFEKLLAELEGNGVLRRSESGYLYSQRMVKDESARKSKAKSGKTGAEKRWQNDSKGHGKTMAKGMANPMAKNGSSSSSSSSSSDSKPPTPLPGEDSTANESNKFDLAAPSPIILDRDKPAPFGLDHAAFDRADWMVIEAAFIDRWNSIGVGVVSTRGKSLPTKLVREFQNRCCEPGWLVAAERALAKFPLKCLTGGMRLATFFDPETVNAILAGNYDFDPSRRPAEKQPERDKTQEVIDHEQAKHRERTAAAQARKEQQERLKIKWSAQASILTDAEIAELAEKHPQLGLAKIKTEADQPGAHGLRKVILQTALCKALELDRGLNPAEAELVVF